MDTIPQKQCTGPCQKFLPATTEFFYASTSNKDGLRKFCKVCYRARDKAYSEAHVEEKRARGRAYYQAHAEKHQSYRRAHAEEKRAYAKVYRQIHTEKCRASQKRYEQTHAEEKRAYQKAYYEAHTEELRAYARAYLKAHPEQSHAHKCKRRALKRRNGGAHTAVDIRKQYAAQKGKCYYCHCKLIKWQVDHIVPLSRGGSNDPSNLVIACPTCNNRKNDKLPHEWPEGGRLL